MQYLLLLYANEGGWNQLTPEQQEQGKAAYMAYGEALRKAGAFVGSNRLKPIANATTVRIANGKTQVRRLLPHRRTRSGLRPVLGCALSGREPRSRRSAPRVADAGTRMTEDDDAIPVDASYERVRLGQPDCGSAARFPAKNAREPPTVSGLRSRRSVAS